eukprot:s77_g29.t1
MADYLPCYHGHELQHKDFDLKELKVGTPVMPHLTSVSIPPSPGSFRPPSEDSFADHSYGGGKNRVSEDKDSDARFELLGETLQRLSYQVQRQEDRQLAQHQQIVRFEGTLQGLQEDRETMGFCTSAARLQTLEKGQAAVAAGAQRAMQLAMKAAEAQQTMSDRQDEMHGRNSHELSLCTGRVEQLEQHVQQLEDQLEKLSKQKESNWAQRLDQHEAAQKRLEQRMKHFEGDNQNLHGRCGKLEKQLEAVDRRLHCLEDVPEQRLMAEFKAESQERCQQLQDLLEKNHQDFEQRLKGLNTLVAKHDQKMEAIDVAVGELQASAADVLFEGCLPENQAKAPLEALAGGELGASVAKMHEQISRIEEQIQEILTKSQERQKEEISEADIGELRRRLDDLSELLDEQRLTQLRHFSMALPEINNKLELLGRQAAECNAKTEAFEVRLDLTRTNLDTQEQRLQTLSSRFEKTQRRDCPGLDDLIANPEGKPQKQHFDIKALARKQLEMKECTKNAKNEVTKLADAAKVLQKVEGLVTPKLVKEDMTEKTPSFGDRDDCLKQELEATMVEPDESQASLSGDDALPFGFSMSTAVRRSISGFTG